MRKLLCVPLTRVLCSLQEGITSHAVPIRRKRSPWNKGLTIPESTKLKISLAQKRRWRNSPHLRASVCAKLKAMHLHTLNSWSFKP